MPRVPQGAGTGPAREAGGSRPDVGATETPEIHISPIGASGNCEEATGRAPGTVNTATTRAAADTRTPEATGAAGTPRRADKGSAGTVTTQDQQVGP